MLISKLSFDVFLKPYWVDRPITGWLSKLAGASCGAPEKMETQPSLVSFKHEGVHFKLGWLVESVESMALQSGDVHEICWESQVHLMAGA